MIFEELKRLLSERGEVGDELDNNTDPAASGDEGTAEAATEVDPFDAARTAVGNQDTTQSATSDTTQAQDTFLSGSDLDPRKLPPELQPIFKRMQGVYTKRFQDLSSLREKADVVDRFYQDRDFAQETLVSWAAQNGFQLTPINGAASQQGRSPQQGAGGVPAQLTEAFKTNLAPELQWMAEPMAAAMGQSLQQLLQPVLGQQQKVQQQQRVQEWQKHADELQGVAPGWEEHEDVMTDLHEFLKSGDLYHPKYGSKIEMLYNLATAKAAAMKQATDRVNSAAKNRVSSGRSGPRANPINDQIAKAPNSNQAWELAIKAAKQQLNM